MRVCACCIGGGGNHNQPTKMVCVHLHIKHTNSLPDLLLFQFSFYARMTIALVSRFHQLQTMHAKSSGKLVFVCERERETDREKERGGVRNGGR